MQAFQVSVNTRTRMCMCSCVTSERGVRLRSAALYTLCVREERRHGVIPGLYCFMRVLVLYI